MDWSKGNCFTGKDFETVLSEMEPFALSLFEVGYGGEVLFTPGDYYINEDECARRDLGKIPGTEFFISLYGTKTSYRVTVARYYYTPDKLMVRVDRFTECPHCESMIIQETHTGNAVDMSARDILYFVVDIVDLMG